MSYAKMTAADPARDMRSAEPSTKNNADTPNDEPRDASKDESKTEPAQADENLADALRAVNLTPSLVVNGSGTGSSTSDADRKVASQDGPSEDPYQRAESGSDAGTKPPSLDGKSIASGTTFALDEKESLRPDDSASVKAAEDDDEFSNRDSNVAGSRTGSEAAGKTMFLSV